MFKCFCDACGKEVQQDKQSSAVARKLSTSKLKTHISFTVEEINSPHVCQNCQIVAIEDLLLCLRLNANATPTTEAKSKSCCPHPI